MLEQMEFNFEQEKSQKKIDDPNRQLMIKYKYNKISDEQLNELHDKIKKLLYDLIHKNFVKVNTKDVYQQIWKKIAKAKHSWNENAGTRVSTWIVCVCMSVINGLRMKQKKIDDRYILYDDLQEREEGDSLPGQQIAQKYGLMEEKPLQSICFSEEFKKFMDTLNDNERDIINLVLYSDVNDLNKGNELKYQKKKITKAYIREKLGMKQKKFFDIMQGLKQRFHRMIIQKD